MGDRAPSAVFADPSGRREQRTRRSLRLLSGLLAAAVVALVFSVASGVRLPVVTAPVTLPSPERPVPHPRQPGSGSTAHAAPVTVPVGIVLGGRSAGALAPSATTGPASAARTAAAPGRPSALPSLSASPTTPATPTPAQGSSHGRASGTPHRTAPSTPPGKTKSHP